MISYSTTFHYLGSGPHHTHTYCHGVSDEGIHRIIPSPRRGITPPEFRRGQGRQAIWTRSGLADGTTRATLNIPVQMATCPSAFFPRRGVPLGIYIERDAPTTGESMAM